MRASRRKNVQRRCQGDPRTTPPGAPRRSREEKCGDFEASHVLGANSADASPIFDLETVVILSTIRREARRSPLPSSGCTRMRTGALSVGSEVKAQMVSDGRAPNGIVLKDQGRPRFCSRSPRLLKPSRLRHASFDILESDRVDEGLVVVGAIAFATSDDCLRASARKCGSALSGIRILTSRERSAAPARSRFD